MIDDFKKISNDDMCKIKFTPANHDKIKISVMTLDSAQILSVKFDKISDKISDIVSKTPDISFSINTQRLINILRKFKDDYMEVKYENNKVYFTSIYRVTKSGFKSHSVEYVKNNFVLPVPPFIAEQVFTLEDVTLTLHDNVNDDAKIKGIYKISDIITACSVTSFEDTQFQLTNNYPLFVCNTNSSVVLIAGFSPCDERCRCMPISSEATVKLCVHE